MFNCRYLKDGKIVEEYKAENIHVAIDWMDHSYPLVTDGYYMTLDDINILLKEHSLKFGDNEWQMEYIKD